MAPEFLPLLFALVILTDLLMGSHSISVVSAFNAFPENELPGSSCVSGGTRNCLTSEAKAKEALLLYKKEVHANVDLKTKHLRKPGGGDFYSQ